MSDETLFDGCGTPQRTEALALFDRGPAATAPAPARAELPGQGAMFDLPEHDV